jgi:hypothetical protein
MAPWAPCITKFMRAPPGAEVRPHQGAPKGLLAGGVALSKRQRHRVRSRQCLRGAWAATSSNMHVEWHMHVEVMVMLPFRKCPHDWIWPHQACPADRGHAIRFAAWCCETTFCLHMHMGPTNSLLSAQVTTVRIAVDSACSKGPFAILVHSPDAHAHEIGAPQHTFRDDDSEQALAARMGTTARTPSSRPLVSSSPVVCSLVRTAEMTSTALSRAHPGPPNCTRS